MVTTFSLAKLRACAIVFVIGFILQSEAQFSKKNKCLNPPRTAKKVEDNIKHCQDEVKNKLVREAYQILKDEVSEEFVEESEQEDTIVHGVVFSEKSDRLWPPNRRNFNHIYSPTLVPYQDKRIAGCLLHCVYAKNNAIDQMGWPTLDGLVDFYSEGVSEHGFFMATLRAVNSCLNVVTVKYRVNRRKSPENGESCDLAFDVFDCISDQITGYCLDHFRQA